MDLHAYIRGIVDTAPPLTPEQARRLGAVSGLPALAVSASRVGTETDEAFTRRDLAVAS